MYRFERKHLVVPVILGLGWLAIPGGVLDRHRFVAQHRHPHGPSSPAEAAIAAVARTIVGRDVEVRCVDLTTTTAAEPLGLVLWPLGKPSDYMELRPDVCTTLTRFRHERLRPCAAGDVACLQRVDAVAQAITAVAHESYHLRGVRHEAETECYAVQRVETTARAFGASAHQADALAWWTWHMVYPHMPPPYRTRECRAGGQLDLHTGSPWT